MAVISSRSSSVGDHVDYVVGFQAADEAVHLNV